MDCLHFVLLAGPLALASIYRNCALFTHKLVTKSCALRSIHPTPSTSVAVVVIVVVFPLLIRTSSSLLPVSLTYSQVVGHVSVVSGCLFRFAISSISD